MRLDGVASDKVTDFAGEAAAADTGVLRDYTSAKRAALIPCLVHKARARARDEGEGEGEEVQLPHTLSATPDTYEVHLDVDFTQLTPNRGPEAKVAL
ncbi:hypothetical protein [Streptomyces sp. NPDC005780]|uniref:hypothetical protein n=1 Tax=Streptomyces sp. NPDC005780 TaxID=3364730 RepID=UPI0036A1DCD6